LTQTEDEHFLLSVRGSSRNVNFDGESMALGVPRFESSPVSIFAKGLETPGVAEGRAFPGKNSGDQLRNLRSDQSAPASAKQVFRRHGASADSAERIDNQRAATTVHQVCGSRLTDLCHVARVPGGCVLCRHRMYPIVRFTMKYWRVPGVSGIR
jgi:hypothetical protein